jgi:hypothetical protein
MKSGLALASLVLTYSLSAFAGGPSHYDLCGVPVTPYGCDADVCILELHTSSGNLSLQADSESLITRNSLLNMARVGGVQCFSGYQLDNTYFVEGFAD